MGFFCLCGCGVYLGDLVGACFGCCCSFVCGMCGCEMNCCGSVVRVLGFCILFVLLGLACVQTVSMFWLFVPIFLLLLVLLFEWVLGVVVLLVDCVVLVFVLVLVLVSLRF